MRIPSKGFTIVELLIVVVVIGILAIITIVTFNGIQVKAENDKTISAVGVYAKALKLYSTSDTTTTFPVYGSFPCLGQASTTCGVTPASSCFGIGSVTGSAAFVTQMRTVITDVPEPSSQSITCSAGGATAKGAFYWSNGSLAYIYYFLRGNVTCDYPAGLQIYSRAFSVDTTYCIGRLNT